MANEKRLVWTDDVMSFLCKRCNEMYSDEPCEPSDCLMLEELDKCKTVDAVEVVHGRWDRWWCDNYLQYFHRCSVCGDDALTADGTMHDEVLSNYCPNCGAKMDGDGNV